MPRTAQEILDIQNIVTNKGIPYLVHFTNVENLDSILNKGLYPRAQIDSDPLIKASVNDTIRVDYKPQYNCTSISFPNSRMFYKCRQTEQTDWVVLILHPKILWEKKCLFYPTNAASNTVSQLPIDQFSTTQALENMFDGQRDVWLESHDPTDVQAEVMIHGIIEPEYIVYCLFDNAVVMNQYVQAFPDMKMMVHSSFFSNRQYAREHGFKK